MGEALLELTRRIVLAENTRAVHRSAGHFIDAAACEVRIQALREAKAIILGSPLPPTEMLQSGWSRTASHPPSHKEDSHGEG